MNRELAKHCIRNIGITAPIKIKSASYVGDYFIPNTAQLLESFYYSIGVENINWKYFTVGQLAGMYNEIISGNGASLTGVLGLNNGKRSYVMADIDQIKLELMREYKAPKKSLWSKIKGLTRITKH